MMWKEAALGDEALDAYPYPLCAPTRARTPTRRPQGQGRCGPDTGATLPPPQPPPPGAARALLSQVRTGLGPRPRKPSSRDVAVQVNPRRDASVQRSLGRRTLSRAGAACRAGPTGSVVQGRPWASSQDLPSLTGLPRQYVLTEPPNKGIAHQSLALGP
uniref:Uncharacterized protein n=1 Tax=Oryctolagus cuniculus TaxID=9986 RepID=A0A5F9C9F2_RABIT